MEDEQQSHEEQDWFQRIKQESWEAELIVSAIGTFASFQLFGLIDHLSYWAFSALPPAQHFMGYMVVFTGIIAVSMLTTIFVLHLFLRFYWVGLVGLNSVFPDFGRENSAFSRSYTDKMLAILPKLKTSVLSIDEKCSILFSIAFCLVIVYGYFALLVTLLLWLYNMLSLFLPSWLALLPAICLALMFIFQNVVSMVANIKKMHSNEPLQLTYFRTTVFLNKLLIGPFYKNAMQIFMTFGSNYKSKKSLIGLGILCFVGGMAGSIYHTVNSNAVYLVDHDRFTKSNHVYNEYYASENASTSFVFAPELSEIATSKNMLSLFIPIFHHELKVAKQLCLAERIDIDKDDGKESLLACRHRYHDVKLNGQPIDLEFLHYDHPSAQQRGLLSYIPMTLASTGKNVLSIQKSLSGEVNYEWSIPFYYYPQD